MHGSQDIMSRNQESEKEYPNGLGVMTKVETEHPCVIVHPITGRKSLYLNNWPCKRLAGMTQEESAPLKKHVNTVAIQPENVYRHRWSVGDVVMIDQRCTMHYAMHDYDHNTATRVMQRATITDAGDAPGVNGFPT